MVKHIFITSDGGAGHVTAARNLIQRLSQPQDALEVNITKEAWMTFEGALPEWASLVINPLSFVNKKIDGKYNWGQYGIDRWNAAQINGDMDTLKTLIANQPRANTLFAPTIKQKMKALLEAHPDLETVTVTQPIGTLTICQTINEFNEANLKRENKKPIQLCLVLTDMLTQYADHFLDSLRSLNPTQLAHLEINIDLGPVPYFIGNPCEYDLHYLMQQYCPNLYVDGRLPTNVKINESAGPINDAFLKIKEEKATLRQKPAMIHYAYDAYQSYIVFGKYWIKDKLIKLANQNASTDYQYKFNLHIPEDVDVQTILLGSQGSKNLMRSIINTQYKKYQASQKATWIFAFCGKPCDNDSLFCSTYLLSEKYHRESAGKFSIIPLTFQTAETTSHLRAIATDNIRPGGLSGLETNCIQPKEVNVFAEKPAVKKGEVIQPNMNIKNIMKNLLGWERGNTQGLNYFRLVNGLSPVQIFDEETYGTEQTEAVNANLADLPNIVNPFIKACITDDLLAVCCVHEMHAESRSQFTIGFATAVALYSNKNIYDLDETIDEEEVETLIKNNYNALTFYANCYISGCELLPQGQHLVHPSSFAMKFAEYMLMQFKQQPRTLVANDKNFSEFLTQQYPLATLFARLFYEPRLHIFDSNVIYAYLENYQNQAAELPYETIVKELCDQQTLITDAAALGDFIPVLDMSASETDEANEQSDFSFDTHNPDEIDIYRDYANAWQANTSTLENVKTCFKNYSTRGVFLFRRNHADKDVQDIIDQLNTYNALTKDKVVLNLLRFHNKKWAEQETPADKNRDSRKRMGYLISKLEYLIAQKKKNEEHFVPQKEVFKF